MMTIDEFMRDIAPKMRKGFVFYDWMGGWQFSADKPLFEDEDGWYMKNENSDSFSELKMFNIQPVENWEKSLRKVGK